MSGAPPPPHPLPSFRRSAQLLAEESIAKGALLEECFKDPGFRDRISILTRSFDHRKQVPGDSPNTACV